MAGDSLFDSSSFFSLDPIERLVMRGVLYHGASLENAFDFRHLFDHRASLKTSYEFYSKRLSETNPALFQFLNPAQRQVQLEALELSLYLFLAQYQLDRVEGRWQNQHALKEKIKTCSDYIDSLKALSTPEAAEHAEAIHSSSQPARYVGMQLVASFLVKKIDEYISVTDVTRTWITEINNRRLYWVWGGGLLTSILEALPDDFANRLQMDRVFDATSPPLGYFSWIIYYTRLGLELGLVMRHTLPNPWMHKLEYEIPWWQRFQTQWEQRKFALLNDAIWGTVNLVTFFWLTGRGMMGYWGNLLTCGLLLFDTSLAIWQFVEESTAHNKQMLLFQAEIAALDGEIQSATEANRPLLTERKMRIERARNEADFNWRYKKSGLTYDLIYSVALFAAFSVMVGAFFPPAALLPAVALVLSIAGATLCFSLSVAYAAVKGELDVQKARHSGKLAQEACEKLLELYKESTDDIEKKRLYLDMRQLTAQSAYQAHVASFQRLKLIHRVVVEAFIPALVFAALMFLPLGPGIAVLAAGLALAAISLVILRQFEPKEAALPEFDEAKYLEFYKEKTLETLQNQAKESAHPQRLFSPPAKRVDTTDGATPPNPTHGPEDAASS